MESSPSLRASQAHGGTPLYPVSPERINQRHPPSPSRASDLHQLQQSPSKGSDVQSKVAFLNGLSRTNSPAPSHHQSATTSAALQRAILGREEAESALEGAMSQLSEARTRERKISERVESLLEELESAKKSQSRERAVYEKEVRKAKKEAFRAGSAIVKVQEELKSSRSEAKGLKDELEAERAAKEQAKQEAFEHEYKLAGVTEELTVVKDKLRTLEASNHANELEAQARRMRKKGKLTVGDVLAGVNNEPISPGLEAAVTREVLYGSLTPGKSEPPGGRNRKSPSALTLMRRMIPGPPTPDKSGDYDAYLLNEKVHIDDVDEDYIEDLKDVIRGYKRALKDKEKTIEFMRLECQFLECPCRVAESRGERFVHDVEYDNMLQEREKAKGKDQTHDDNHRSIFASKPRRVPRAIEKDATSQGVKSEEGQPDEPEVSFSPSTGTFRPVPSPAKEGPCEQEPQKSEDAEMADADGAIYQQSPTPTRRHTPPPQQARPESPPDDLPPLRLLPPGTRLPPRRPEEVLEELRSLPIITSHISSQPPEVVLEQLRSLSKVNTHIPRQRPESAMEDVQPSQSFPTGATRRHVPPPQHARPKSAMEPVRPLRSLQTGTTRAQPQRPSSRTASARPPMRPKTPSNSQRPERPAAHGPASNNYPDNFHHSTSSAITNTVTTTTTVPLRTDDSKKSADLHATIPGTPVTRQEALAQIKARRSRARSNASSSRSTSACDMNSRPPSRARVVTPVRRGRQTPGPTERSDRVHKPQSSSRERRQISASSRR